MAEHTAITANEVVEQLAEHRLDWDRIKHRIDAALDHDPLDNPPDHHLGPYVTVVRQSGTGGGVLAHRIGEILGWPVLDGEIVDLIADTFHLDGAMLHLLDESKANWVQEVLAELTPTEIVSRDTYVHHLGSVLRLAALHGHVVLVGRGAQLFLPRTRGLAVRLVAPKEHRIWRVGARDGVDQEAARRRVHDIDQRRSRFVKHYFGRDIDDPLLYDLVLNASTLSMDDLAEVVVTACRRRGFAQAH
jgi:cytidylate kinase